MLDDLRFAFRTLARHRTCRFITVLTLALGIGPAASIFSVTKSLLFETFAQDPWVLAAVGGILLITSVLACILPAQRATKAAITHLLRSE